MSLEARLQTASAEYQRIQAELSTAVGARQRLDAQLSENELVKKEFAQLTADNVVYKLIGPVLVKQDQSEAKSNVEKRLDFIQSEITRIEALLAELGDKAEKTKLAIVGMRTELQQKGGLDAPQIAAGAGVAASA